MESASLLSESLPTLYNTLILPYLAYCTIVWGDKNNSDLNSLKRKLFAHVLISFGLHIQHHYLDP